MGVLILDPSTQAIFFHKAFDRQGIGDLWFIPTLSSGIFESEHVSLHPKVIFPLFLHMGVSKNNVKTPKMDGENNGKPYKTWMIWGAHPYIWKHPYPLCCKNMGQCRSL